MFEEASGEDKSRCFDECYESSENGVVRDIGRKRGSTTEEHGTIQEAIDKLASEADENYWDSLGQSPMSFDEQEVIQVSDSDDGTGVLVVGDITGCKREREDCQQCCLSAGGRQNLSGAQKTRAKGKWLLSVPLQCDPQTSNCLLRCSIEDGGSFRLVGPDSSHAPPIPLFQYEYYRQSSWNSKSAVTKFCFVCLLAKSGLYFNNPPCCQSICDKCTLELVRAGIDLHNSQPECAVRAPFIGGKRFYLYLRKALGKVPGSRGRNSRHKKRRRKKHHAAKPLWHLSEPSDIAPDGLPVWRSLELSQGCEDDSDSSDGCPTEKRKRHKTDSLETGKGTQSNPLSENLLAPANKINDCSNPDEHKIVVSDIPDSHKCPPAVGVKVYTKQIRISGPSPGDQFVDRTKNVAEQCKGNRALREPSIETLNTGTKNPELSIKSSAPKGLINREVQCIPKMGGGYLLAPSGKLPIPIVTPTPTQRQFQLKRSDCALQSNSKSIDSEEVWYRQVPLGSDSPMKVLTPGEYLSSGGRKVQKTADRSVYANPLLSIPVSLPRPGTVEVPSSVPSFVVDILNRQSGLSVHGKGVSSCFKQVAAPVVPGPMVLDPSMAVRATLQEPSLGCNHSLGKLILCSYGLMNMAIDPPLPSLELKRIVKTTNDALNNRTSKRPTVTNLRSLQSVRALAAAAAAAATQPILPRKWPVYRSKRTSHYLPIPNFVRPRQGESVLRSGASLQCLRCRAVISSRPGYLPSSSTGTSQTICESCCTFPSRLVTQHGASHLSSQTQINGCSNAMPGGKPCTVVDLLSDDEDITQPCGKRADVQSLNKSSARLLPTSKGLTSAHEKGFSAHEMGKLRPLLDAVETATTSLPHRVSSFDGNQNTKSGVTVLVPKRKRSMRSGGVVGWVGNRKEFGTQAHMHTKKYKASSKCFAGCSLGGSYALHNSKRRENFAREKLTAKRSLQAQTLARRSRLQKRQQLSAVLSTLGQDRMLPSFSKKSDGSAVSPVISLKSQCGPIENGVPGFLVPVDKSTGSNVQSMQSAVLEPLRKSSTRVEASMDTSVCHRSSLRLSKIKVDLDKSKQGHRDPRVNFPGFVRNGKVLAEAERSKKGREERTPDVREFKGHHVQKINIGSTAHACPTPGIVSAVFGVESSVVQRKLIGSQGDASRQRKAVEIDYYGQSKPPRNFEVLEQRPSPDHTNFVDKKSSVGNLNASTESGNVPGSGSEAARKQAHVDEIMDKVDGSVLCPHKSSLVWKPAHSIFVQWSEAELQERVSHIGVRGLVESLMKLAHAKLEDL